MDQARNKHRFAVLDGWRGVAALAVAVYHFHVYSHVAGARLTQGAYLFVDLFFVLSGFVISYSYGGRLTQGSDIAIFMIRRFGRLWPLHAATLLFLFVFEGLKLYAAQRGWLHPAHPPFDPAGFATWTTLPTNLVLMQALGLHDNLSWNVPAWSICVEFWTYLVFATLCWSGRRSLTIGAGAGVLFGFLIVLLAGKGMDVSYDYGFFRCLFGFFLGHFAFRLWQGWEGRPPRWLGHCELPALAATVLFVAFAGGGKTASLFAPLLFAPVVLVFAAEQGAVSSAMRAQPIARLGAWSYSIYMVHAPITDIVQWLAASAERVLHVPLRATFAGFGDVPILSAGGNLYLGDAAYPVYIAAILLVSAATYRWIEKPGRRFFNAVAMRRVLPAE
ncbi:MAG TPA: acyltransferase [Stellaceae bacterium]